MCDGFCQVVHVPTPVGVRENVVECWARGSLHDDWIAAHFVLLRERVVGTEGDVVEALRVDFRLPG